MSSSNEKTAIASDPGHDNDRHEDDLLSFEDAVDQSCGGVSFAEKEAEPEKVKVIVNVPTTTPTQPLLSVVPAKDLQLVPLAVPEMRFNLSSSSLVEIPLHESDSEDHEVDGGMGDDLEDDEVDDGEHADHLSPLMIDNHTIVEHHECFQQQQHSPTMPDLPPVMVVDSAGNITVMRHSDTKDSLSSVDSDLGMSFDRHQGPSAGSNGNSSPSSASDQDPSRDSGCETGPCIPMRPYCPVEVDEGVEANAADEDDDLNDDERPFQIPDDEFSERIVEQVEFYFSNENILKDAFLLKHVRRNKEGFVSLKLVSSFKRVRQLTKDWRVVGHAIRRKSHTIELNDLGTKVRRHEALPNYDETMPSRTVVATDLPLDKMTIEKVYEMFSKCGEIALVRILRVGGPIPADVRQFINKYPELLQKECALVEFVESKSARNALAFEEITVLEMIAPKKKTGKKAPLTRMMSDSQPPSSLIMYGPPSGGGMDGERSRGGAPLENVTPPRFQMRRNSAGYYNKPDQVIYVPPPRKFGYNNGSNPAFAYSNNNGGAPPSNNQRNAPAGYHHPPAPHYPQQYQQPYPGQPPMQQPQAVHYHHQVVHQPAPLPAPCTVGPAETYEVYQPQQQRPVSHMVAVPTNNKTHERRYSNCSDNGVPLDARRGSKISVGTPPTQQPAMHECQCNCQANAPRRVSLQNSNDLMYRRISQSSPNAPQLESPRKLSAHSAPFERKVSTTETNWRNEAPAPERKYSNDQMTAIQYHQPQHVSHQQHHHHQGYHQTMPESPIRKYSNGFDPLRKLSDTDEYVNGRRISTDSGYDRKYSFSSDSSNVRSRSNSFICNHNPVEQIIRTPVGPAGDGSRGFGTRTRKIGHILPPV